MAERPRTGEWTKAQGDAVAEIARPGEYAEGREVAKFDLRILIRVDLQLRRYFNFNTPPGM